MVSASDNYNIRQNSARLQSIEHLSMMLRIPQIAITYPNYDHIVAWFKYWLRDGVNIRNINHQLFVDKMWPPNRIIAYHSKILRINVDNSQIDILFIFADISYNTNLRVL